MNDPRPTDPREQMEVRITALLLGEASAFEEAELLEAIKHDPTLAAYYEEMRQMVRRVEETIQLTPIEAPASQSKLAEARRDKLQELFKQPVPAKTIKLDSHAGRARRVGWLQNVAAIAAAAVILLTAIVMILPSLVRAKRMMVMRASAPANGGTPELRNFSPVGALAYENGLDFLEETRDQANITSAQAEPEVELDERYLARYGNSSVENRSKRPARTLTTQPAEQPPAPAKPADIYLPPASVDTAGVPVQMSAAGAERGVAADTAARYYFRDSGVAPAQDSVPVEGAAAVVDSPTLAFAIPDVSALRPSPAPVPLELQAGRPELLTDSLARKGDAAAESEVVQGKKLAMPAPALAAKSEAEELRPVIVTGSQAPLSEAERRFRRLSDIEAKDSDFDGAALQAGSVRSRTSGGTRGAQVDGLAAFGSVPSSELDRNAVLASSTGLGRNQGGGGGGGGSRGWSEGRSDAAAPGLAGGLAVVAGEPIAPGGPANAPVAASEAFAYFDAPATGAPVAALGNQAQAANAWHADFGAIAAAPAPETFGRGGVADDFVINGQVSTDLFAKQLADTKSVERLDRLETSLGLAVEEAKDPAEPMYEDRLLTEQRQQVNRERVEESGKQVAARAEHDLDPVKLSAKFIEVDGEDKRLLKELGDHLAVRGEGMELADVELKRKTAELERLGALGETDSPQVSAQESLASGVRFLTSTNQLSAVNQALGDYLKAEGVELSGASTSFYNDRTGNLIVRAPAAEMEKVERAMDRLNRGETSLAELELKRNAADPERLGVLNQPKAGAAYTSIGDQLAVLNEVPTLGDLPALGRLFEQTGTTQSRLDTLADLSSSEFAMAAEPKSLGSLNTSSSSTDQIANSVSRFDFMLDDANVGAAEGRMKEFFGNDVPTQTRGSEAETINRFVGRYGYLVVPDGATVALGDTQSRFDTLADLSSSEFAMAADNGREQQLQQQIESASVASPEVTQLAEEVVEAQPATPPPPSLEPLPEIRTADNAFSTFSLNVSDVSFQLAASSLENGQMPDGARLRSEEFINAFDYRDPLPAPGQRVAFNWERARNPFAHNRELLRFSVQTAAAGREPGQPLNLVLLLDNSGSMERADRVQITEQMLRVLAAQLTGYDRVSFVTFARTPRLIVDGATGGNPEALLKQVTGLNPDGGTNLEDAMKLAYETAAKHFQANGNNRVILITDGAANLGNVDPAQLRERVIEQRKRGIALDCFGVGWEGYNDNLLESLSRNGDGRYGFLNDAENAPAQFASQLAGALQVAAADVKAQVEFNPNRVTVYRQIGYQQHQLTKEQFRDNTVDAAEIGAAEAGNALYSIEVNPTGSGPIGTFRARYRLPSTGQYEEKEWVLDYTLNAVELEQSVPAMRLASTAAAFAEWLANSPYAQTVTPDALQNLLRDVPQTFAPDPRPAKLQAMIQQARAISGR